MESPPRLTTSTREPGIVTRRIAPIRGSVALPLAVAAAGAFAVLSACAHAPVAGPDRYVSWRGRIWGDSIALPDGSNPSGGWTILRDSIEYAVSELPLRDGGRLLVLDSLTGRTPAGRPVWKILDVLRVPAPGRGAQFVPGRCFRQGTEPDGSVFGFARGNAAEVLTDIVSAWTVDWSRKRFQEIPPRGLRCRYEGFGL